VPSPVEQSSIRKSRLSQIQKAEVDRAIRRQRLVDIEGEAQVLLPSNRMRRTGWTERSIRSESLCLGHAEKIPEGE
jgi:hypothetical protein